MHMLFILDVDFTLNQFYPPSIQDLAPAHLLEQPGPPLWDWIIKHLRSVEYPVHEKAVEVLRWLGHGTPTVVVSTGRPEALRPVTERWLRRFFHFEALFMRPTGDFRPNAEIKQDALTHAILPRAGARQVYAFEDDPNTLAMYQQAGVTTFAAPACWEQLHACTQDDPDPITVRSVLRQCSEDV